MGNSYVTTINTYATTLDWTKVQGDSGCLSITFKPSTDVYISQGFGASGVAPDANDAQLLAGEVITFGPFERHAAQPVFAFAGVADGVALTIHSE